MIAPRAARLPITALPLVDIGDWYGTDTVRATATAEAVFRACRDIGFLYVSGHKILPAQIAATFEAARAFFALSEGAKQEVHYRHAGFHRGYLPLLSESSDPAAKGDLKEAFDCGLATIGNGEIGNLWPNRPEGFRQIIEAYLLATRSLAADLLAMIAHGLGMDDDWFAAKVDNPIATLRLLRYPAQTPPNSSEVLGIGEHCDYECLTVLAQDAVGGLQVRGIDGEWIEAPPLPGAFVINVGEMLARWSNDVLVATAHRVVNTSGAERYSIPVFFATNPDVVIEPLASCVSENNPARYPPVRAAEYLDKRIQEIYLDVLQGDLAQP